MKNTAIYLFHFFSLTLVAQQSEIHGIVSIHNSEYETGKRQYVQNAQVEDDFEKATPTTTSSDGTFKLVFVKVAEKTSVNLNVKKEGLQVVNIDGLNAVTGQRDMVRLSMSKPEKIAEYRRQIYKVGKTEAEKNLAIQLKKKGEQIEILQKDAQKNKTTIEQLQKEYGELQAFATKIEEQAQDLARRYAPVNLDDAAPLYRESFGLFQKGELDKALQILRGADLVGQADKILAERKAIGTIRQEANQRDSLQQKRTEDLMQVLGLKADLHHARFEWDSVQICLELRVNLDSNDVYNLWRLGDFLAEQNKKHEAIYYYEKALNLAQTPALQATFLNNVAVQYSDNQNMYLAEGAYKKALIIRRQLIEKNPQEFLPDFVSTLINLGSYYFRNQKMQQAEEAYNEALLVMKQEEDSSGVLLPYMATAMTNLGAFYIENQKMSQAEITLNEALEINRELAEENPDVFRQDVARTLVNLGGCYATNQKISQAENAFVEALKIFRELGEKNPDAFLPYVVNILNNLGLFYSETKKAQAEILFVEALKKARLLSQKNPDAFLPEVAKILNNLGVFYRDTKNKVQAEADLIEALDIRKQLVEKNPEVFLPELANTLDNLGVFYGLNHKEVQAEEAFINALKIKKELAIKNSDVFLPSVATTLNNLGFFYQNLKDYNRALTYYSEAIAYREAAILKGEAHFIKDWGQIARNILELKDIALSNDDHIQVIKAEYLIAKSCDNLKNVSEQFLSFAVTEYRKLSWLVLFLKNYQFAEKYALRCLELDKTQESVLSNLGHSQLFRGQFKNALFTYNRLKGKKNNQGKDYKYIILNDFKILESEGITHKDMPRMKVEIEKW